MTQKRSRAIDILCEPTLYLDNLSGLKKLQRKLTASQRNMPYVWFFLTFLKHLLNVKFFFFKKPTYFTPVSRMLKNVLFLPCVKHMCD